MRIIKQPPRVRLVGPFYLYSPLERKTRYHHSATSPSRFISIPRGLVGVTLLILNGIPARSSFFLSCHRGFRLAARKRARLSDHRLSHRRGDKD